MESTCTVAGSYDSVVYCSVCNAELSRETITVDKLGHTPGETVVENEVAADCESAGSYDNVVYCTVCDAEISRETVTVDALGHKTIETPAQAATCNDAGNNAYWTCETCDKVFKDAAGEAETTVEAETIPAIAHKNVTDETEWVSDDTNHWKVCPDCGENVNSGAHSYVDRVCSVCGIEEELPDFGFKANVIVENNLDMMFAFPKKVLSDWSGHYVKFIREYADGRKTESTIPYNEWGASGSYYTVSYREFAAKEMSDEITVVICNESHQEVCKPWTDSLRIYAHRALSSSTTPQLLKTVVVDMLNYGTAAQQHFNYGTDDLANSWLTEEEKQYASESEAIVDYSNKDSSKWIGSNLITTSSIEFKFAFKGITSGMYATIEYEDFRGNPKTHTFKYSDFVASGTTYRMIVFNTLSISDARSILKITVYNSDGSVFTEGQESIESYVARGGAAGAFAAFMKFADSARAYLLSK